MLRMFEVERLALIERKGQAKLRLARPDSPPPRMRFFRAFRDTKTGDRDEPARVLGPGLCGLGWQPAFSRPLKD